MMIEVENLTKYFGPILAVRDVSFQVENNEIVGLLGNNGAGKSTTFNMVNGQLRPDSGHVRLDGKDLVGLKPRQIWQMGVSRTFQIAETFATLTVVENVQMAFLSADARLFNVWRRATLYRRTEALELLAQVGLHEQADRPCSQLAYGDVKRLELAIALANRPRLLLMDEPTAGMSVDEVPVVLDLIRQLKTRSDCAILLVEHKMDVVRELADRVVVMARGAALHGRLSTRSLHQGTDVTLAQLDKCTTLQTTWQHHRTIADTNQSAHRVAHRFKHAIKIALIVGIVEGKHLLVIHVCHVGHVAFFHTLIKDVQDHIVVAEVILAERASKFHILIPGKVFGILHVVSVACLAGVARHLVVFG